MELFTLQNNNGIKIEITNFGGRIVRLFTPDNEGRIDDIVLGYEKLENYKTSNEKYYGALIGRYANRIAKGKFHLNGAEFNLSKNEDENTLHGGEPGFHDAEWNVGKVTGNEILLTHFSPHGEEGFPGNLRLRAKYSINDNNELKVEYEAVTDEPTPVSFTHHSFFNLTGDTAKSILDHVLTINGSSFTPVNEKLIPTGRIRNVSDTPFDFRKPVRIGERINENDEQLKYGIGYDHNWILDDYKENGDIGFAARIFEPVSGRVMEVFTNEPGLQFYSGNFLNGSDIGKNDQPYNYRSAFCLESQRFPDSPNHPDFPTCILKPGNIYHSVCIYKFTAE